MKPHAAALFCFLSLSASAADFSLTSQEVQDGALLNVQQVYRGDGCHGANISPSLSWRGEPVGTKSFAITVFDPDAPNLGRGWWHWMVVNIPASTHQLPKGAGIAGSRALPAGSLQLKNDFDETAYGGACPPVGNGVHRYQFTLWALKVDHLDLTTDTAGSKLRSLLESQSLGSATITAHYRRQ